jgi:hypothetical protein
MPGSRPGALEVDRPGQAEQFLLGGRAAVEHLPAVLDAIKVKFSW